MAGSFSGPPHIEYTEFSSKGGAPWGRLPFSGPGKARPPGRGAENRSAWLGARLPPLPGWCSNYVLFSFGGPPAFGATIDPFCHLGALYGKLQSGKERKERCWKYITFGWRGGSGVLREGGKGNVGKSLLFFPNMRGMGEKRYGKMGGALWLPGMLQKMRDAEDGNRTAGRLSCADGWTCCQVAGSVTRAVGSKGGVQLSLRAVGPCRSVGLPPPTSPFRLHYVCAGEAYFSRYAFSCVGMLFWRVAISGILLFSAKAGT